MQCFNGIFDFKHETLIHPKLHIHMFVYVYVCIYLIGYIIFYKGFCTNITYEIMPKNSKYIFFLCIVEKLCGLNLYLQGGCEAIRN